MGWISLVRQVGSRALKKLTPPKKTPSPKQEPKPKTQNNNQKKEQEPAKRPEQMSQDTKAQVAKEGEKLKQQGLSTEDQYIKDRSKASGDEDPYRARELAEEKPAYEPEIQNISNAKSTAKGRGIEP